MANLNPTEISLMKGLATKLDEGLLFLLAYMVHTEKKTLTTPAKSEYLYVGRILKQEDLEKEILELNADENKLNPWKWPGLEKYDSIVYAKFNTNGNGSKWYKNKLNKLVDWPTFSKIVNGYKDKTGEFNNNAKYCIEDYETSDGSVKIKNILEEKDLLKTLEGKTIIHKMMLKRSV